MRFLNELRQMAGIFEVNPEKMSFTFGDDNRNFEVTMAPMLEPGPDAMFLFTAVNVVEGDDLTKIPNLMVATTDLQVTDEELRKYGLSCCFCSNEPNQVIFCCPSLVFLEALHSVNNAF